MPVCISTGCCVDLGLDRLGSIYFLEKYWEKIDGVELVFAFPSEALEFEFDKKAIVFLQSLEHNSIHAPFKEVAYENNDETKRLLEKIVQIAGTVKAKNVVFHPDKIKDYKPIEGVGFPVAIENLNKKPEYKGFQTVREIKAILGKHPRLSFCFDTAHAVSCGIGPVEFLALKQKISSIHINTQWIRKSDNKQKEHGFLIEIKDSDKKQFEQNLPFLKLNKPLIIEADFYQEKVHLIEKEIELLKGFNEAKNEAG